MSSGKAGARGGGVGLSSQVAVQRLVTEDGFRKTTKEAFAKCTREAEGLDVLQRCKKLNEFLASGVRRGSGWV